MKHANLDENKPLSNSIIWKLQRDFFHNEGINAWQNKVPFYVTSNTYFSSQISKIIRIYLLEALIHGVLNPDKPIYIVELGTGAGQFSYQCIVDLFNHGKHLTDWGLNIRYVMTDFTKSNLEFWNNHDNFKSYIQSEKLDFAQFDCDNPNEFKTQHHKWEFNKNSIENPIILITNYVYDSITHDLFRFANGEIEEGLLSVNTHKNNLKNNQVQDLHKLECSFSYKKTNSNHYPDPRLNNLLKYYQENIYNGVITIPIGAIKCIDFFNQVSNSGIFNITSDKGYSNFQSFDGTSEIHVAFHSSFSLMVNFHALGFLTNDEENAYVPGLNDSGLKTCLLFFNHKSLTFPETVLALEEGLNSFSSEDYLNIKNELLDSIDKMSLNNTLSFLKFSNWDSKIFKSIQIELMEKVSNLNNSNTEVLLAGIPKLEEKFYELPNNQCPHFDIARLYHFARNYEPAIEHYKISIEKKIDEAASYFNIGLCYYCLFEYKSAEMAFIECKKISPDFQNVDEWISKVESPFES